MQIVSVSPDDDEAYRRPHSGEEEKRPFAGEMYKAYAHERAQKLDDAQKHGGHELVHGSLQSVEYHHGVRLRFEMC